MKITDIQNPRFLKDYSRKDCQQLANDIRQFLLENVSKTGGHLSSNLGVVELTIAMHKVFDAPEDKFIFDVGHQSYVHKILTGRANRFSTLRQYKGLSGFQKRSESPYDCWEAGHSSTSLSAAYGIAVARDIKHENYQVIPVIGDGSLTSGLALEALNNIGGDKDKHKVIIIFNDNNMSISSNVGGLSNAFSKLRSSKTYTDIKKELRSNLNVTKTGKAILHKMTNVRNTIKHDLMKNSIFKEYGIDYLGPIDGHDFKELLPALEMAKQHQHSIVVHVMTTKGKGYSYAENDAVGVWHGVGKFDVESGRFMSACPDNMISWSKLMSDHLYKLAKTDPSLCAITPAMMYGSALSNFASQYPDRMFDCGIAEEHAVTFAAGLASNGMHPFVSIYSSFLQRAYDEIQHDVARQDLPVIFGVDRCGLVGEDGSTHQGIYDISFLATIPNVVIAQPKDAYEAACLLYTASKYMHPFALRYPRGTVLINQDEPKLIKIGTWTNVTQQNKEYAIISYGPDVDRLVQKIEENEMNLDVINARFLKPLDEKMLIELAHQYKKIFVYETDTEVNGLTSRINMFYYEHHMQVSMTHFAIQDHFVTHGSIPELRKQEGIDINTVLSKIEREITD